MIIQIRGTSGSGKTTAMRTVMETITGKSPMDGWKQVMREGRKKPIAYWRNGLYVLGHYESACGGCDNVGSAAKVFDEIAALGIATQVGVKSENILAEGLLLSEDFKWTNLLGQMGHDVRVYFLTTDVETCLQQIRLRRELAGNTKPLNENNTRNRVARIESARIRLTEAGNVTCRRLNFDQTVERVLKDLKYAERN